MRRVALAIALFGTAASPALAQTTPSFPLDVDVRPVLPGAVEAVVELKNRSDVAASGHVDLETYGYSAFGTARRTVADAPFSLGPKATGRLVLLATTPDRFELTARVTLDDGAELETTRSRSYGSSNAQFVDLDGTTTLIGAIADAQLTTSSSRETLSASGPTTMPSGATPLPTTLGGYSGTALVHVGTNHLLELGQPELTALADWIGHGGTLALSVDAASHLTDARFVALLGGTARALPADPSMYGDAARVSRYSAVLGGSDENDNEASRSTHVSPSARIELNDYRGGNLQGSVFGAIAAYGIGRVVVLPFNARLAAGEEWVIGKLSELTVDAAAHGKHALSDPGQRTGSDGPELKRALDPNQRFRISLGIATVLLLSYAAALTVLLIRDHKRRQVLRPFVWLPALAGVVSLLIVGFGFGTRGAQRGIRRVFLLESGAGFGLVSVDEYRGYFTSGSDLLTLVGQSPRSLLYADALEPVHHRDGFSFMRGKPQLPWQTSITRELRVAQSDQNVALGDVAGMPWVTNHTTATLEDVLLTGSNGDVFLIAKIGPGESTVARADQLAAHGVSFGNGFYAHNYNLPAEAIERLGKRYGALGALSSERELHPATIPSLLAIAVDTIPFVDQPANASEDGLPIHTSSTYVHVVGAGGVQ